MAGLHRNLDYDKWLAHMDELAGRTSVLVPAYNEIQAVTRLIAALKDAAAWHEILVIDDGSTDGTGDEASELEPASCAIPTTKATARPSRRGCATPRAPSS